MAISTGWHDTYPYPKVKISITGGCNLSCFYCNVIGNDVPKTGVKWSLLPSDAGRFARALAEKGITHLEISGGEPLLRKDASAFVKSISSVKAIKSLTLKTNGTFLKNHADALRKAGLKKLVIGLCSLNFMKYQKITGRDNLYRVLDGLEKAERLKFNELVINILVMGGINSNELIEFAMLTKTRPLHVRFIEFHPKVQEEVPIHEKLNMSILHIKRTIDGFQKLFPCDDDLLDGGHPRFRFRDATGTLSFMNASDIMKARGVPTIMLNSLGEICNTRNPAKSINILRELRRDSKDNKLSKILDKQIVSALGKKKTKAKPKKRSRVTARHTKRRYARA